MTDAVVAIAVGLLTLVGVFLTVRGGKDARLDTERSAERARQDARIAKLEQHQHVLEDYVYELRTHIDRKLPPPPPDWPEELRRA